MAQKWRNNGRKSITVVTEWGLSPPFHTKLIMTGACPSTLLQRRTDHLLARKTKLPSKDYSTSCTKTKKSGMKNENLARKSEKWIVFSKCCLKKWKSGLKTKIGA
ncbi:hypothetical protein AS034_01730 [[Bacillus] enclensis]|nr:hypothetical protein AS034_01730 [[Bacillus] enclensis]